MIRFIATRLRSSRGTSGVSRPAIIIATAGVAIGLTVMTLTVCVAIGFKQEIHDIVRRTGGDMHIVNSSTINNEHRSTLQVNDSVLSAIREFPGVSEAFRVSTCLGCLKTDSGFIGVQLIGTDAANAHKSLASTVADLNENDIIISSHQASQLRLAVGDKVMAYFFDTSIRARRFTIADVYTTNINDFDATQVFASYETVHRLASSSEGECDYVQVFLSPDYIRMADADIPTDNDAVAYQLTLLRHIRKLIPITPECQPAVVTLEEQHPQIFSWLALLDLNVWVILALMLCVAGFTMASGLLILILERTQMIGLLKALGARFSTLRRIFIYIALGILLRGMLIGNIIALAMAYAQQQLHIVRLNPADYYVDAVPITVPWQELVALNVGTVALTMLLLVVPTYIIAHISPVKAMKFE